MEAHPDTDLESASNGSPSNIALNRLIRAEVRAAVKAEVKASMAVSAPPAYDSGSNAIASTLSSNPARDSCSSTKDSVTDTSPLHPVQAPETETPTVQPQVPQRPLGWYRISLAILPWLIILVVVPALSRTVDKQGLSYLALFLAIINLAAMFLIIMVLSCAFAKTWGTDKPVDPRDVKRSNFTAAIMFSWHSLLCCALFGYVLYLRFFQRKGSIGQVYGEAKALDGLLGVDGVVGSLVGCLKGRVGGRNVTMADLDGCFAGLGVSG